MAWEIGLDFSIKLGNDLLATEFVYVAPCAERGGSCEEVGWCFCLWSGRDTSDLSNGRQEGLESADLGLSSCE